MHNKALNASGNTVAGSLRSEGQLPAALTQTLSGFKTCTFEMSSVNQLPDIAELPSVLETSQVNEILAKALLAAQTNSSVCPIEAVGCMVDAIFARGHRHDEQFDSELAREICSWIMNNWVGCDLEFADAATTVLTNLPGKTVGQQIQNLVESEQREPVVQMLKQCVVERENAG